jgi:hypothetical protein
MDKKSGNISSMFPVVVENNGVEPMTFPKCLRDAPATTLNIPKIKNRPLGRFKACGEGRGNVELFCGGFGEFYYNYDLLNEIY